MLEKVKSALAGLVDKLPVNAKNCNMLIYYLFLAGFISLCLLYVAGWASNWSKTDIADLAALLSFMTLYVGPFALAFISTLARKIVDRDGNGQSDEDEKLL